MVLVVLEASRSTVLVVMVATVVRRHAMWLHAVSREGSAERPVTRVARRAAMVARRRVWVPRARRPVASVVSVVVASLVRLVPAVTEAPPRRLEPERLVPMEVQEAPEVSDQLAMAATEVTEALRSSTVTRAGECTVAWAVVEDSQAEESAALVALLLESAARLRLKERPGPTRNSSCSFVHVSRARFSESHCIRSNRGSLG